MSIADKLTLLAGTKEDLRVKLDLGVDVPFSKYVDYIKQQYDITKLFLNGKQGVWYDPSDRSTLFQDAGGKIPVTKYGDPVGLMLDKSQGIATNSIEMVDADLGVTGDPFKIRASSVKTEGRRYKVQTTEVVDGQYGAAVATVDGFLPLNVPVEIEIKVHALQIADITGGHAFHIRNSSGVNMGTLGTLIRIDNIGTYRVRHIRTTDHDTLNMIMMGGVATVGDYIEFEVSVKEIKGNHATQSVSASRPIYKTDGILHWLEFDGTDDFMVSTYASAVTTPTTLAAGVDVKSLPPIAGAFIGGLSVDARHQINHTSSGLLAAYGGTGGGILPEKTKVGKYIWVSHLNGEFSDFVVNNRVTKGSLSSNSIKGMAMGAVSDGTFSVNADFYGIIQVEGLANTTDLQKYLRSKMEVIL